MHGVVPRELTWIDDEPVVLLLSPQILVELWPVKTLP